MGLQMSDSDATIWGGGRTLSSTWLQRKPEQGASWTTCTSADADGKFCDAPTATGSPVSMCPSHLMAAFSFCQEMVARAGMAAASGLDIETAERSLKPKRPPSPPIVYYVRIGEFIKIGTTTQPAVRFRVLEVDEVLATEPGSFDLEARRHVQFGHLRIEDLRGRELFRAGDDLLRHIESLRSQAGQLAA